MIYLTTGQPGHGKTLLTIAEVYELAKKENRPVFYSGIKINPEGPLKDWVEHDPLKWFELPPRAIMLIDEAQKTFRPRGTGSAVPKHEEELETHRHGGIDIYVITQHPMFVSTHIRRLAHMHRHVVRVHGLQVAIRHEWNAVRDDCDKAGRREDSNSKKIPYPKEVYNWYKSAEVHTVKRTIPKAFYVLAAVPLLLIAAVLYMKGFTESFTKPGGSGVPDSVQGAPAALGTQTGTQTQTRLDPVEDARQFVAMNTPRVEGLPHTAPKYDEITKPDAVPVPVACVASASKCLCYTQQGTRMQVRDQQCRDIAEFGYFQEFKPDGHQSDRERAGRSVAVLNSQEKLPISGASTADRSPVVVLSDAVTGRRVGGG